MELSTEATVTANVLINNAIDSSAIVSWTSSDENIVTVDNGVITCVGAGYATVIATYISPFSNENYTAEIDVRIKPLKECINHKKIKLARNWCINAESL